MSDLFDYVRVCVFEKFPANISISGEYLERTELLAVFQGKFSAILEPFDILQLISLEEISWEIFQELLDVGQIKVVSDPRAGDFYWADLPSVARYMRKAIEGNEIFIRKSMLKADKLYEAAFANFKYRDYGFDDEPSDNALPSAVEQALEAPASDRVVTYDHNAPQTKEVLELTEQANEAIRGSNSLESEERGWIREHIAAGVDFIRRHKKVLTGAVEALLIKPLRAAYEAIAEEPAKAAIMAAIKAIKTMFGL